MKTSHTAIVAGALLAVLLPGVSAGSPPAGQMCPTGEYVIGFDHESNIVCSGAVNKVVPAAAAAPVVAVAAPSAPTPAAANTLTIEDAQPSAVVYGRREVVLMLIGSGFRTGAQVRFRGENYTGTVDASGSRMQVTLPTGDLVIGAYSLTVINGPGEEATLRRAFEVY